ncbi:MAG: TetR/AcrR family transcriptional regulator [Methylophilaceae bacterium]|uniref:TetR/AcrR family transcriptional regulator n=1 Tax=Methylovorus sp. MM2 TaxID=1848038 RepID=UPI0020B649AE|nr:TetR/AcrR family transcriptional regulator [Methylovorus sp. MM2]
MNESIVKLNSSNRKEITHTRIVETAARAIRRSGYDGTGVADIMKEAGLTHGGFYAHFASRDAMLAEAANRAGEETTAIAKKIFAEVPQDQALRALMNAYLSYEHIANIETGCSLAALGSEMPRQAPEVRKASTRRIKEMIALIESQLSDQPNAREDALVMVSAMVGTLLLARAVEDPELSDAFREATLKHYDAKE